MCEYETARLFHEFSIYFIFEDNINVKTVNRCSFNKEYAKEFSVKFFSKFTISLLFAV